MTDAELNLWAAGFMEPQNPAWSPYANSPGKWWWWDSIDLRWEWDKRATASLDVAALVEAEVIERVGHDKYTEALEKVLWPNLIPVANDPFQRIDVYMFITTTARQRVMACYEAMRQLQARTEGETKGEG